MRRNLRQASFLRDYMLSMPGSCSLSQPRFFSPRYFTAYCIVFTGIRNSRQSRIATAGEFKNVRWAVIAADGRAESEEGG